MLRACRSDACEYDRKRVSDPDRCQKTGLPFELPETVRRTSYAVRQCTQVYDSNR